MNNNGAEPGQTVAPSPPTPPETPLLVPEQPYVSVPTGLRHLDDPENVANPADPVETDEIVWTASEFVAHEKAADWYGGLTLAAAVIGGLVYWVTRDTVSVGVVVFGAIIFGVYGSRKPRQLEYRLDGGGLSIGQKYHGYDEFRSFAVAPEGAFSSVVFMPLKRFAIPVTIYYAPEDEDKIVSILADHLPFEEHKPDPIDRLARRIRF